MVDSRLLRSLRRRGLRRGLWRAVLAKPVAGWHAAKAHAVRVRPLVALLAEEEVMLVCLVADVTRNLVLSEKER